MFHKVCSKQDIQQVQKTANIIWREHYTPIIGEQQVSYMLNKFHSVEAIADQIKNQNYLYYLIIQDEEPTGYFSIQIRQSELFLSKIYVLAEKRGLGVGKSAMEFIKQIARQRQLGKISLTVNKYNSDSIAAYFRIGFKNCGEVITDIGAGFVMDDFIMELNL